MSANIGPLTPDDVKYLGADDIRDSGLLMEINRLFLHPLGLAASLDMEEGSLKIWDSREDPEGVIFAFDDVDSMLEKASKFDAFQHAKWQERKARLGFIIQPLPDQFTPVAD